MSKSYSVIHVLYSSDLYYFYTFFFFNDTATTEIYTLSLHDALPISISGKMQMRFLGRSYSLTLFQYKLPYELPIVAMSAMNAILNHLGEPHKGVEVITLDRKSVV